MTTDHAQTDTPLTRQLVQHARAKEATADDLAMAALFVLDAVANALGGCASEQGRKLLRWAGNGPSRPGTPFDTGSHALLMGALTHILETDDLHRASVVHPGCVVVPAAWVMALREGTSGPAFLRSVLEGFEVTTRVGMGVGPAHYRIWHNTATCGPYGSAMAAATLLGLNEDQTVHALGNAGSQSSGLWEFLDTGAMTKHLHAGHAAQAGVQSADLAALGFTGPPRILEGERGFFAATCPDGDASRVMSDPDGPWQLPLTSMKPWPSCRHTHPAIDASLELSGKLKHASADEFHSVTVETYQAAEDVCDRPHADSEYEAKFSLQHCIATALENGEVTLASFDDAARVKARRLASGITIKVMDPYAASYPVDWGSAVEIVMTDGTKHRAERGFAKGDPEAPLTPPEVVEKSLGLMEFGGVAAPKQLAEAILALPMAERLPPLPLFA
ncbi:MmgE/PrpD family protein [Pyruvatibacter sp.]|uniref:MmgE/PrpD family protein n=1 Tax=Pyruvatibacter sp. TaxID=1981328 RepID=UPI003265B641